MPPVVVFFSLCTLVNFCTFFFLFNLSTFHSSEFLVGEGKLFFPSSKGIGRGGLVGVGVTECDSFELRLEE